MAQDAGDRKDGAHRHAKPATAAAPVLAGLLSVVLFPGTALTVLARYRREVPR